ncbi:hypothetical protein UPYG_G00131880 [Umbra pygmaea]|uniref:Uncharacterized protein n=1 Tax=Umbra pygmaea TaxID=75934 RepID=A0ABD0XG15_UMBPY
MFEFTVAQGLTPKVLKPRPDESQHVTQRGTVREEEERGRTGTKPKMVLDPFELFLVKPRGAKQSKPVGGVEQTRQGRFWSTQSYLCGVTKKDQLGKMRHFERQVLGTQDLKRQQLCERQQGCQRVREKTRKGAKEAVRSEHAQEIKTDYDLYLNSLLTTQTSLDNTSTLDDLGIIGAEDLEEAGNEVSRLGEEALWALEENDRVRKEIQNAHERFTPGDEGPCQEFTLTKQQRVWTLLEELQLMQKEIQENMASIVSIETTKSCIRDSKDLENNINMILNRSRSSQNEKAEVWNKIWSALKTRDDMIEQPLLN